MASIAISKESQKGSNFLKSNSEVMDVKIFENILKTLDPSIEKVRKSDEVKNSYILTLKGEDLIIQDGEFVKKIIFFLVEQKQV